MITLASSRATSQRITSPSGFCAAPSRRTTFSTDGDPHSSSIARSATVGRRHDAQVEHQAGWPASGGARARRAPMSGIGRFLQRLGLDEHVAQLRPRRAPRRPASARRSARWSSTSSPMDAHGRDQVELVVEARGRPVGDAAPPPRPCPPRWRSFRRTARRPRARARSWRVEVHEVVGVEDDALEVALVPAHADAVAEGVAHRPASLPPLWNCDRALRATEVAANRPLPSAAGPSLRTHVPRSETAVRHGARPHRRVLDARRVPPGGPGRRRSRERPRRTKPLRLRPSQRSADGRRRRTRRACRGAASREAGGRDRAGRRCAGAVAWRGRDPRGAPPGGHAEARVLPRHGHADRRVRIGAPAGKQQRTSRGRARDARAALPRRLAGGRLRSRRRSSSAQPLDRLRALALGRAVQLHEAQEQRAGPGCRASISSTL